MTTSTEKKNAIDRFKERPFRQRVFIFLGMVVAWVLLIIILSASKKEKETANSYLVYLSTSTFFIFIVFKLIFKRFDQ